MAVNEVITRLKSQLLTSGLSQRDQPLFQIINQLIDYLRSVSKDVDVVTGGGTGLINHDHTSVPGDGGILTNDEHDGYSEYSIIADPGIPSSATKKRIWNQDISGFEFLTSRDADGRDLTLARDNVIIVRNVTGGPLTKGQAVYFNGAATGNFPHVSLAQSNSEATMPAIGLLFEDVANNNFGRVMVWGRLTNINTSAFGAGDLLYVSETTPGVLTNVIPSGPNSQIQRVGVVAVSGAGNGAIVVTQTSIRFPRIISNNLGLLPVERECNPDPFTPYPVRDISLWEFFTPSWFGSTSNPSIGDGFLFGKFRRDGSTVHFYIFLQIGGTTTLGSGFWTFSIPVPSNFPGNTPLGLTGCFDSSLGAFYTGFNVLSTGTIVVPRVLDLALGGMTLLTPTIPFSWAPGDNLAFSGAYEAS